MSNKKMKIFDFYLIGAVSFLAEGWLVWFSLFCGLWAGPPANAPQKRENKPKPTIKFENGMKKSMKAIHEKQSIC